MSFPNRTIVLGNVILKVPKVNITWVATNVTSQKNKWRDRFLKHVMGSQKIARRLS